MPNDLTPEEQQFVQQHSGLLSDALRQMSQGSMTREQLRDALIREAVPSTLADKMADGVEQAVLLVWTRERLRAGGGRDEIVAGLVAKGMRREGAVDLVERVQQFEKQNPAPRGPRTREPFTDAGLALLNLLAPLRKHTVATSAAILIALAAAFALAPSGPARLPWLLTAILLILAPIFVPIILGTTLVLIGMQILKRRVGKGGR